MLHFVVPQRAGIDGKTECRVHPFAVARTTGIPVHYFVSFHEKGLSGRRLVELNKEQARKWVLFAENVKGQGM